MFENVEMKNNLVEDGNFHKNNFKLLLKIILLILLIVGGFFIKNHIENFKITIPKQQIVNELKHFKGVISETNYDIYYKTENQEVGIYENGIDLSYIALAKLNSKNGLIKDPSINNYFPVVFEIGKMTLDFDFNKIYLKNNGDFFIPSIQGEDIEIKNLRKMVVDQMVKKGIRNKYDEFINSIELIDMSNDYLINRNVYYMLLSLFTEPVFNYQENKVEISFKFSK